MKPDRFALCIFCEDVRQEADGKLSLMGVLQGGITLTQPSPQTIARLFIVSYINAPIERPIDRLRMSVTWAGKEVAGIEIDSGQLRSMKELAKTSFPKNGYIINLVIPVFGMVVEHSGDLRVIFQTESEELEGNVLRVSTDHQAPVATPHIAAT